MKIGRYLLGLFATLFFLIGCDDENRKLVYRSDTDTYVSFRTDKLEKILEKTENSLRIPVYRESVKGAAELTAKLLFQQKADGTEVPGREFISLENEVIRFADGENSAYVNLLIDLTKLDYLTKAKTQIKLNESSSLSLSPFGKTAMVVSLSRKPTWTPMQEKGTYISALLQTRKDVTVIKAEEAPFYIIKDCYVANGDIRVDLDREGNAVIEQQRAFRHEEYGVVYTVGTGKLDELQNRIVMQLSFLVEQENGSWGVLGGTTSEEVLMLPSK